MTTHVEARHLHALRRARLDPEGERTVRLHLAEACPGCARAVAGVIAERQGLENDEPIVPRSFRIDTLALRRRVEAAAWEEAVAPGLMKSLELWEEPEAFRLIAEERAYQTLALASHLVDRSRSTVFVSSVRGYHLARLSIAVAAHADERRYGAASCFDLKAEAAMALANASRCRSRFYEARRALQMAETFVEQGTREPSRRAQLASVRSSIATALGYHRAALEAAREGGRALLGSEAGELDFKLRLKLAGMTGFVDPLRSIALNEELIPSINRDEQPALDFCARFSIANSLQALGRAEEALHRLRALERHPAVVFSRAYELRVRQTQSRALSAQGRFDEASRMVEEIITEHRHGDEGMEVASALVDLAEISLSSGNLRAARRRASEGAARFSAMGAEHYARIAARIPTRH